MTADPSPLIESVLSRLDRVKASAGQWVASCPCRDDDHNPSLSIREGRDGRVLMRCHRGGDACTLDQICAAVGLDVRDLHSPSTRPTGGFVDGKLIKTYPYYDADGVLILEVLRFRTPEGRKEFRQRTPDPGEPSGWRYSTTHLPHKPLYRLPEVLAAINTGRVIYVCEGEKDVDALWDAGFAATCNPQGADDGKGSKWKPNHTDTLAHCRVVVVADNDAPGRVHANYVATQLARAGSTVKVKCCPEPHKDPHDLLGAGGAFPGDLIEVRTYDPDPFYAIAQAIAGIADTEAPPDAKAATALQLLHGVHLDDPDPVTVTAPALGRLVTWADFLDEVPTDTYDWLIEGMLERGERLMLVAAEGAGKTTMGRQVAILAGAGIHPFTYAEIPPITTLFVDLENPEKIIRRQSRRILDAVAYHYPKRTVSAHLYTKPNGLNIFADADRRLLETHIQRVQPDLVCLGPIYKAFIDPGGKTSTALVTEAAMYFDHLRVTYDIALWLEHHAPLGNALTGRDLRPADSAVWMRWPEYGFALAIDPTSTGREYEFKRWRGPRDVRTWPHKLRRGALFPFEVTEWSDPE